MDEDGRGSPVELVEDDVEPRITEVDVTVVGEQPNAVEMKVVERSGDLGEARVGVRQRQGGERSEPPRMAVDELGRGVVDTARARSVASDPSSSTPGLEMERYAVSMPVASRNRIASSSDQSGARADAVGRPTVAIHRWPGSASGMK